MPDRSRSVLSDSCEIATIALIWEVETLYDNVSTACFLEVAIAKREKNNRR
ncbi:hypothetical protein [Baaleninema simplex]|uniref:hypothetical protein n=1 Tax=Baaleninema simplex TaxID=2862350 RepID=UPI000367099D|nr:hypothetical protein [Baaleninema simplex]